MPRSLSAILLLALLSLAAACGSTRQGPARPAPPRTTVRVENQSFMEMTIYVVRDGGQRIRLGSVPGVSTRSFTIPSSLIFGIASLSFVADPVGARARPVSHQISVQAGDEVMLTIPNY